MLAASKLQSHLLEYIKKAQGEFSNQPEFGACDLLTVKHHCNHIAVELVRIDE